MPKKSFLDNLKGVLGLGGAKQSRGLFLGLDASGRTTLLYRLVLGECVPTIPTIGFNVETVTHRNTNFTLWDVGGCDKIRPLWRHYFQGTCVMFFFVDSADRERLQDAFKEITKYVLCEDALKGVPLVLVMTKQDLPGCMPPSEILDKLQVEKNLRGRWWKHVAVATPEGIGIEEVKEAMWEANEAFLAGSCSSSSAAPPSGSAEGEKEKEEAEKRREETKAGDRNLKGQNIAEVLEDWLSREDEEAEVFLAHLENFTLESWDHYTHLRIAWLLINTHGRREGFRLIFARIEAFIKNSELTKRADRQTTFHQTMTYFWAHMIHYALEAARDPRAKTDFKFFLAFNPQLCNSGMFLHFYAKERMLNDPKARTEVVLPDRKPLPSLISSIEREGPLPPAHEHLPVGDSVSDSLFLQLFEGNRLPSWGHAAFIRLIYCRLKTQGRRKATDSLFASLKNLQKGAFHETKTYFWIQMVTHALATDFHACIFDSSSDKEEKAGPEMPEFEDLMQGKGGAGRFSYAASKLRELTVDTQFFHAFYSKKLIESKEAEESFVLPDKKPLPSFAAPR